MADCRTAAIEAALAHVVQNIVEAAYRRTDLFERRRRLMDDWAHTWPVEVFLGVGNHPTMGEYCFVRPAGALDQLRSAVFGQFRESTG